MGIAERREREKEQRRKDILAAAWAVAEEVGWASFSVERVAAHAELGRATVYGYFEKLEALVQAMAEEALEMLSTRVAEAEGLPEALDVPLRFAQKHPAAFALLFQEGAVDARAEFSDDNLGDARREARQMLSALHRLAERSSATLPENAAEAQAFVAAVAMAGVAVPELRANTPLRRRWQDFVLAVTPVHDRGLRPAEPGSAPEPPRKRDP